MKPNKLAFLVIAVLLLCAVFPLLGQKPLQSLDTGKIEKIKVTLQPPEESAMIEDSQDIEELASLLKNIVVSRKTKKNDYMGQSATFNIYFKDGSSKECILFAPLFCVGGNWYQAKYHSLDELTAYYHKINERNKIDSSIEVSPQEYGYPLLTELTKDYSIEQAIADGCYVESVDGIFGKDKIETFLEQCQKEVPAFLRAVESTKEGDPIILDLIYDGQEYQLTLDSTRDQFGEGKVESFLFNGLEQREDGIYLLGETQTMQLCSYVQSETNYEEKNK